MSKTSNFQSATKDLGLLLIQGGQKSFQQIQGTCGFMFKCQLSTWGKDEKTRDVSVSWCAEDRMRHTTFDNSGKWENVNVEGIALQRRGNKNSKKETGKKCN